MRYDDVEIRDGGELVNVRFLARGVDPALAVVAHAEAAPPLGYILKSSRVSRRPKGGRARFVTLTYAHTGNEHHPPMDDWVEWAETLGEEEDIARGSAPVALDSEA